MAVIEIDGVRFGFDEAGSGPAVVLVHGGLGDRRMWNHQFTELSHRYRVIRYDWRGHGESGDAEGEVAHHEDLLAVLDALEVERAALVGGSFGGAYSVEAALKAPHRVSALGLVCSGLAGHVWPPEFVDAARARVLSSVPAERLQGYRDHTADRVDPADVEAMARAQTMFMTVGPGRSRSALASDVWNLAITMCELVFERNWNGPDTTERWLDPPAVGRLGELGMPVLVVNGLADVPSVQAVSDLLTEGIENAERIDLSDTGHLPSIERPVETTRALVEFLDRAHLE